VTTDIRKHRILAGWSQFDLSAATGIDRSRLSMYENGHYAPSVDEALIIERALLSAIADRTKELNAVLASNAA
jgi:transcriptional regulator with XRE-family HTH domain